MFLILIGHIFVGFIPMCTNGSDAFHTILTHFIFFITFHVNLFVLISGYCGIRSLKGVLKTWKLVFSYLLLIAILNIFFSWGDFDYSSLLFPLSKNPWWFMRIYTMLALLSPLLLEPLLSYISKQKLLLLIGVLLLIDVYFGFICHVPTLHNGGYDLIHFLTIYLLGSYLRICNVKFLSIKRIPLKAYHFFAAFIVVMILKIVWHLVIVRIGFIDYYADYNHPFNILLAICAFLAFLKLDITNNKIRFVSSSVIGVYLLQEHPLIKGWLMIVFDTLVGHCNGMLLKELFLIPLFVTTIFTIAILVDKIRLRLLCWTEYLFVFTYNKIKSTEKE